jgi:hypothetical protein
MKRHFKKTVITLAWLLCAQNALAQTPQNVATHFIANGRDPAIAGDYNDAAHLVFVSKLGGVTVTDIFYTATGDSGKTWSTPISISNTPGISTEPSIALEGNGSLDAVWTDTSTADQTPDIFFARSTDAGKTWTKAKDISNTPRKSSAPKIIVGKNNSLHVVWCDTSKGEKNQDIYYSSSTDGGEHWAQNPLLPAIDISNTPGLSSQPTIATDHEGVVSVAWVDTSSGVRSPDIFYCRYSQNSWSKPVDISNSVRISSHPSLSCARAKCYLCWADNSRKESAPDIWLEIGDSVTGRFNGKPINVSNTNGVSSEPELSANGAGWLGVVWADTTTGASHIFARVSLDRGSYYSNVMDLTSKSGGCIHPQVALIGKKMVVVWQEHIADQDTLNSTSLRIDGIATGPAMLVDPSIKGMTGNQH